MDTLSSLQSFIRVVELGSFTAAAREAGVSQPSMSKAVAALEQELGARLLKRSTTSLVLTEEGRRFYRRSKGVLEEFEDAKADIRGQTQSLAGRLVVTAPVGLGELRLNALALEFLAAYPGIELELVLNDRYVDLVEEGVDVAIRLGKELPPNLIARKLGASPRVLVATPDYLRRTPKIRTPEDLSRHEYIRFAGVSALTRLEFSKGSARVVVAPRGRYCVNSSLALRQCFLEGAGLGSAPAWLVQDLIDTGALVAVLPGWTLPPQDLHLLYPSRRYQPQRTLALLQFLIERLPQLAGFTEKKSAEAGRKPRAGSTGDS